jgi:hypothetical protein
MDNSFIGNNHQQYDGELAATNFYPSLAFSDFQKLFGYLEEQTEQSIAHQLTIDRAVIHKQLKELTSKFATLTTLSIDTFDDQMTAAFFYEKAVFSLTAANLIGNKIETDATKEAADRKEALSAKYQSLRTQSREAVDMLLNTNTGYTFAQV